jgi:hypothetical protein
MLLFIVELINFRQIIPWPAYRVKANVLVVLSSKCYPREVLMLWCTSHARVPINLSLLCTVIVALIRGSTEYCAYCDNVTTNHISGDARVGSERTAAFAENAWSYHRPYDILYKKKKTTVVHCRNTKIRD